MRFIKKMFSICFCALTIIVSAQRPKTPIMGWSSWNNYRTEINEKLIREQADAMISSGLFDAGYRYINIDDGYFGGRDSNGKLFCHPVKFPSGMKSLADYIHSKGLKAGIYSDVGKNTCASNRWDRDVYGIGSGIYGHIDQDLNLFFKEWGYDFLKVDWCGGRTMKLDEKTEYLKILKSLRTINNSIVFNICRWEFPGEWAVKEADSWRISGDISENFNSICDIIDLNAILAEYCTVGHFNDMDMLQVGRGMTYDEDKSHFSMWCIMNSPLLAGNDLRNMSKETIEILSNKELIALNQDAACKQAKRILVDKGTEVWIKELNDKKTKAIAVFNRGEEQISFFLNPEMSLVSSKSKVRDLWLHKDLGVFGNGQTVIVPKHGIVVLKITEN